MSLVEGREIIEVSETEFVDCNGALERWQHYPASKLSHHGQPCCELAREWVLSMDFSQLNAGSALTGPRWIRHKYTWGPSKWPIYWCEAIRQKTLDCGALAALAHEVFTERGVKSYPVQLIQQFTEHATRQWGKRWGGEEGTIHWIKEDLIYHEGCAISVGGTEIKVWDASAGWWVSPKQFGGYGGVLAIRVFCTDENAPESFSWGAHRITPNEWQRLETARADFA